MGFRVKRVYAAPAPGDGLRVLVDRLWPRGLTRERARLDRWAKEVAPSDELRRWAHAGGGDFAELERRYAAELAARPEAAAALAELRRAGGEGTVTLLFAARDERENNAVALRHLLEREAETGPT